MQVEMLSASAWQDQQLQEVGRLMRTRPAQATSQVAAPDAEPADREAFHDFVGQTFFGQMLQAMRKTTGKPAYFHGGRAEEVFRNQLDQVLAETMADATEQQFSEPMYELFSLGRR